MGIEKTLREQRGLRTFFRLLPTALAMLIAVVGLVIPHDFDITEHHVGVYVALLVLGVVQIGALIISDKQSLQFEPSPLKEGEFVRLYSEALTGLVKSIPLLHAVENGKPVFNEQARRAVVSAILKNICTIAEAYKDDIHRGEHEMNACWYVAVAEDKVSAADKTKAEPFMDKSRTSYKTFLILMEWAYRGERLKTSRWFSKEHPKACVSEGFVLPVDEEAQYTMFGAPLAFMTGDVQYVNDIKSLLANNLALSKLPGMHNESVRAAMIAHFSARKSYESFIDIPVVWGDQSLGVVVIQSMQKVVFDAENKDDLQMLDSMQPFFDILGMFVS
jgi:hypothetical protein